MDKDIKNSKNLALTYDNKGTFYSGGIRFLFIPLSFIKEINSELVKIIGPSAAKTLVYKFGEGLGRQYVKSLKGVLASKKTPKEISENYDLIFSNAGLGEVKIRAIANNKFLAEIINSPSSALFKKSEYNFERGLLAGIHKEIFRKKTFYKFVSDKKSENSVKFKNLVRAIPESKEKLIVIERKKLKAIIKEKTFELEKAKKGLETKVEEKTAELSKKLEELFESNEALKLAKASMGSLMNDALRARNAAEKEVSHSKAIIASMGKALIEIDKDSKILIANELASKLLGMPIAELTGQYVTGAITVLKDGKEVPRTENPILKVAQTKKAISTDPTQDFHFVSAKGKKFPVSFNVTPLLMAGEFIGAVLVFSDISEVKNLDEARINFISIASHQLRTPLTSMRWFSEMLMAGDAGEITEDQRHFVERIYQGTDRMISLVNLLLQIARVDAGRLKIEPVPIDFKNIIRGLRVALKSLLDAKSQTIEFQAAPDPFPAIPMDQEVIWQVLQNILSNAMRYSQNNAKILVTVTKKDKIAEFAVKDKGIGIPKDQQSRIFEKFFRAENALKLVPEGSGLGLSLVKSLVEGWGGKIWFESEEGRGTTFYFTVPLLGMMAKEGEVKLSV